MPRLPVGFEKWIAPSSRWYCYTGRIARAIYRSKAGLKNLIMGMAPRDGLEPPT